LIWLICIVILLYLLIPTCIDTGKVSVWLWVLWVSYSRCYFRHGRSKRIPSSSSSNTTHSRTTASRIILEIYLKTLLYSSYIGRWPTTTHPRRYSNYVFITGAPSACSSQDVCRTTISCTNCSQEDKRGGHIKTFI